ncbi:hypothetical protein NO1_1423 [Candidatus Termititenax aidoneus]|uniref:Xylose isomerase-like TIM barrel domain-containing protein n=1 Tax=Termititenax aidoneus TaxID=2218524 RepID=A0A388TBP6_TERA1|nr:hypothetical protein NO1_1423 [Candidatus Termititenax aidoneus]
MFCKVLALSDRYAAENNLRFSYTFDLRPGHYHAVNFEKFVGLLKNRSIELCNYLQQPYLPLVRAQNFTFHLTRYQKNLEGSQLDLLPGLLSQSEIFADSSSNFYDFIRRNARQIYYISLHLGGVTEDYFFDAELTGAMRPKPEALFVAKNEAVDICLRNLARLRQNLPSGLQDKILLETLDYEFFGGKDNSAYRYLCEPETINFIREHAQTGLLIDIGHVLITVCNLLGARLEADIYAQAINYLDTVSANNYGLIKEVHFFPTGFDAGAGLMHHYDAPLFKGLSPEYFSWEYKLALRVLRHIIAEHNRVSAEKLILNFETPVENMWQDIFLFHNTLREMDRP